MLKPQALLSDASASIVFINIAAMIDITIAVSCIGADGGSASGLQRSSYCYTYHYDVSPSK